MNKERYIRNGKVALYLLRYDVEWVVRRWGYFDTQSTCKFFEFVVSLFKEELGETEKKTKSVKPKKSDTLPAKEPEVTANTTDAEAAGVKPEETL
jgi:hypothetical protein